MGTLSRRRAQVMVPKAIEDLEPAKKATRRTRWALRE